MKKRMVAIIICIILACLLIACGAKDNNEVANASDSTVAEENSATKDAAETAVEEKSDEQEIVEVEEDSLYQEYEPGTTLTICIGELAYNAYQPGFTEFNKLYPDVELIYEVIPNDVNQRKTAIDRLRTALMAGKGADLFILSYTDEFFENTELSMGNGIFADLIPLFEEAQISMDDFIEPVMKAGQVDGKQYVVPIKYGLGLTLTNDISRGVIGEENFNEPAALSEGIKELSLVEDAGSRISTAFPAVQAPFMLGEMFNPYFTAAKCPVDYENFTAEIDTEFSRTVLDNVSNITANLDLMNTNWNAPMTLEEWAEYIKTDKYFIFSKDFKYMLYEIGISDYLGETPNIDVIPMENGGVCAMIDRFAAVRANSVNKENAVNMINILLSKERQTSSYDEVNINAGIWPIRKDCLQDLVNTIVAKGLSPMSMYFKNEVMFEDTLSESIMEQLLDIEASVTEARIAPPWETITMVHGLCHGESDLDATIKNLDEYWQGHIWDAN